MAENDELERLRYLQLKQKASSQPVEDAGFSEAPEIIQEMHPDLSKWDRFVAKNLASDSERQVGYLAKQYPGLEVTASPKGEVLLRKKGETGPYRVLDPDTGFFSKDILNDASDITSDVLQGVGTSAATAAAGTAGALATLPAGGAGAIPAAMAAGAGAETVGETARQSLGKLAGIPDNMDAGLIGLSAATGAISPLLFGTGAGGKAVLSKAAKEGAEAGLPKMVALQQAKKAVANQSGLPMRGIRSVAPGLGELVSGVDKNILKTYAQNFDEITGLEKTGITPLATQTGKDITQGIQNERRRLGKELNKVITESGEAIDIGPAKSAIKSKITELESSSLKTPAEQSQIAELKDLYDNFFTQEFDEVIPAREVATGQIDMLGKPITEAVPETVKKVKKEIPNMLDADQALALQLRLKDPANLSKVTPMSTMNRNAGKSLQTQQVENVASDAVREISDQIDSTIEESISNSVENAEKKGIATPRNLKDQYRRWSQYGRDFKNNFSNPERSYRTLTNLDSPSNMVKQETLAQIDKDLGLNTLQSAQKIRASNIFNNPSFLPISSKGTVSTGRAIPLAVGGGAAGYYLGRQSQDGDNLGGPMGMFLGGGLGAMAGGPRAMRFYIDQMIRAGKLADSPWGTLMRRGVTMPAIEAYKDSKFDKEKK